MPLTPTRRLYLEDDLCFENDARVLEARGNEIAFDQTCFYPGGGGQPADNGLLLLNDLDVFEINSVRAQDEVLWHICESDVSVIAPGQRLKLALNKERRIALTNYHTVLHVLNTIVLRDYDGWITGVQIGDEYSRIDFKVEGFSNLMREELESKVNKVLVEDRVLKSYYIPEDEFRNRKDLLRTLEVRPPVLNGRVRVVEIEGFDAQACGGTHAHTTAEVGRFSIFRVDNKGKINKRFYVKLD